MNDNKIIKDLSILTNIPEYIINKMEEILEKEIQKEIYDAVIFSKKEYINIDLGIGRLIVNVDINKGSLTYDFIPSKSLENGIIQSLRYEENPIIESVEKNLKNKVLSFYKELV